jgi:hypothetical protein
MNERIQTWEEAVDIARSLVTDPMADVGLLARFVIAEAQTAKNLTLVQTRCTELLEEARRLRSEIRQLKDWQRGMENIERITRSMRGASLRGSACFRCGGWGTICAACDKAHGLCECVPLGADLKTASKACPACPSKEGG